MKLGIEEAVNVQGEEGQEKGEWGGILLPHLMAWEELTLPSQWTGEVRHGET